MIALTVSTQSPPPDRFLVNCGAVGIKWDAYHNSPNIGVVPALHKLWEKHREENILIYMHDDLTIHDGNWLERVCLELMAPRVAIVGLGGAAGIGVRSIYKVPYELQQLQRIAYVSNQTGWEIHGEREQGERAVAVVDGYFMAMKGAFLREVGGWDWIQSAFHCYDTAMCLEAHRRGWEVRMAGVDCEHHGGGTSTKEAYIEYCREHGTTVEEEHLAPHRWLYREYRDILPLRVKP